MVLHYFFLFLLQEFAQKERNLVNAESRLHIVCLAVAQLLARLPLPEPSDVSFTVQE